MRRPLTYFIDKNWFWLSQVSCISCEQVCRKRCQNVQVKVVHKDMCRCHSSGKRHLEGRAATEREIAHERLAILGEEGELELVLPMSWSRVFANLKLMKHMCGACSMCRVLALHSDSGTRNTVNDPCLRTAASNKLNVDTATL